MAASCEFESANPSADSYSETSRPQDATIPFAGLRSMLPPPTALKQWANRISAEDIRAFRRQYGNIFSLLSIKVHYPLIEALIHFWDKEAVCFRFGDFELVPTLEEFSRLLDLPHDRDKLVRPFGHGGKENLSHLLGIPRSQLKLTPGLGEAPSKCPVDLLVEYFASEAGFYAHKNIIKGSKDYWEKCRLTALAFAVLGSVLFPGEVGFIDNRIGPIMDQIDDQH